MLDQLKGVFGHLQWIEYAPAGRAEFMFGNTRNKASPAQPLTITEALLSPSVLGGP